ncbi:MAG: hypothetical protein ACXABK_01835 [Candidatus Heimdallarchaeaceae archaeon]|jgi:hypothetical protein
MVSVSKNLLAIYLVLLSIICLIPNAQAYSNTIGVEYNDIVAISFVRYIDDVFSIEYPESSPFEVVIDPSQVNEDLVNELIGMKVGEKKDVAWYVTQTNGTVNYFEYRDTKIVDIVYDSTPGLPPIGGAVITVLEVAGGLGVSVAAIYGIYKIRSLILVKKCADCGKKANSKCASCSSFYCSDCTTKGCPSCGSRKFIRL